MNESFKPTKYEVAKKIEKEEYVKGLSPETNRSLSKLKSLLQICLSVTIVGGGAIALNNVLKNNNEGALGNLSEEGRKTYQALAEEVPPESLRRVLNSTEREAEAIPEHITIAGYEHFPAIFGECESSQEASDVIKKSVPEILAKAIHSLTFSPGVQKDVPEVYGIKGKVAGYAENDPKTCDVIDVHILHDVDVPTSAVKNTLVHEAAHCAEDDMSAEDHAKLLLLLVKRVQDTDRIFFSYVESINNKDRKVEVEKKAKEYFAELCSFIVLDGEEGVDKLHPADQEIIAHFKRATGDIQNWEDASFAKDLNEKVKGFKKDEEIRLRNEGIVRSYTEAGLLYKTKEKIFRISNGYFLLFEISSGGNFDEMLSDKQKEHFEQWRKVARDKGEDGLRLILAKEADELRKQLNSIIEDLDQADFKKEHWFYEAVKKELSYAEELTEYVSIYE